MPQRVWAILIPIASASSRLWSHVGRYIRQLFKVLIITGRCWRDFTNLDDNGDDSWIRRSSHIGRANISFKMPRYTCARSIKIPRSALCSDIKFQSVTGRYAYASLCPLAILVDITPPGILNDFNFYDKFTGPCRARHLRRVRWRQRTWTCVFLCSSLDSVRPFCFDASQLAPPPRRSR
jgi:hypothetical protein